MGIVHESANQPETGLATELKDPKARVHSESTGCHVVDVCRFTLPIRPEL